MRRAAQLVAAVAAVLVSWPAAAAGPEFNYALRCVGCHTFEGVSPPLGRIPPLKDVVGHFARSPEARRYLINVPGIATAQLDPEETAALLNWTIAAYAGTSLPHKFEPFTAEEVLDLRKAPPDDVMQLRAEVRRLLKKQGYDIKPYP